METIDDIVRKIREHDNAALLNPQGRNGKQMNQSTTKKQWYLISQLKSLAKKYGASRQEIHELYVRAGVQHGSEDYEQWKKDDQIKKAYKQMEKHNA